MAAEEVPAVVVGAGLVGLACAYSLATRGLPPVVLEAETPGAGASSGNAGWIVFAPEIAAPVPGPGVVRTSLRWLVQRHSPLRLVPRLEWDYLRWLGRFTLSCRSTVAASGLRATLALNADTARLFEALERDGLDFELRRLGVLVVHRTRQGFESARGAAGEGAQVLSRDEALAAEPLLRPDACAGAIRHHAGWQVKPDRMIDALSERIRHLGGEIRTGAPCLEVIREGHRVSGVRTPEGIVRSRACVLAAGTGVRGLARQVGVRVPIEGGRGYAFEMPRRELAIRAPVYVYDERLALTPFDDVTRVVGMMELGARTATVRRQAITTMNRAGATSFRGWPCTAGDDAWAGLRPMTPDGLPVIGAVRGLENLYVAGGHGMLGVTLSLRTGEAVAESIHRGTDHDPALRPFAPDRYAREVA